MLRYGLANVCMCVQEKRKPGRPPIGSAPRGSGSKPGRVHMSAPTAKVGLSAGRMARNSNKHKRLFDPDEPNGVKVKTSCKPWASLIPSVSFTLLALCIAAAISWDFHTRHLMYCHSACAAGFRAAHF